MRTRHTLPEIPDDAFIRFYTPLWNARHNSWKDSANFDSEEKAREFAASDRGDGSGRIKKKTTFTLLYGDGETTGYANFKLEETLPPVTEFDEGGQKRRERYLELLSCTHEDHTTTFGGAGCQTWTDTTCSKCGKYISGT